MRAPRPNPLVVASVLTLFGCATPPKGPPIVLRKPSPAPHVIKQAGPAKTTPAATAQDETVPLSPSDKDALFRAFDSYLNQAAPQK
jgi:hypothetical protein